MPVNPEPRRELTGQCLRDSIALALRVPPAQVPPRYEGEDVDEWIDKVGEQFNVRFRRVDADELPPPTLQPWIAIVNASGEDTHAVAMIGRRPLGVESMLRPRAADGVLTGLLVEYA